MKDPQKATKLKEFLPEGKAGNKLTRGTAMKTKANRNILPTRSNALLGVTRHVAHITVHTRVQSESAPTARSRALPQSERAPLSPSAHHESERVPLSTSSQHRVRARNTESELTPLSLSSVTSPRSRAPPQTRQPDDRLTPETLLT